MSLSYVHYRLRSQKDDQYAPIPFSGMVIRLGELKRSIAERKKSTGLD